MKLTYKEVIDKYPDLTKSEPHEALVLAAYMAGRCDRIEEEIQNDLDRAARKQIKALTCSENS
jgi:hypothetical protein